MNLSVYDHMPLMALQFAAGVMVGVIFFRALHRAARALVEGGAASTVLMLTVGRFGLVGVLLFIAAREGAGPLLAASLGVFVGRFLVVRAVERQAP